MIEDILISGITDREQANISPFVTRLDVSWTMDAVSQLSFDITDPNLKIWNANYLQKRRELTYKGSTFEIATRALGPGLGASPKITVEARRAQIQKMKRDKNPEAYSGTSPTDYARIVAERFGLKFVGQTTAASKTLIQASTDTTKESVWDVLTRMASEAKFQVFESDGTLYFASQDWLLGRWGNTILTYPTPDGDPYPITELPAFRDSENDVTEAEFTAKMIRTNAVNFRPGMTVALLGTKEFEKFYLITEVSYTEGDGSLVTVSGRTPEKLEAV